MPFSLVHQLILSLDLCEPPSDKDYRDGLKKCQLVMELDMATWKVRSLFQYRCSLLLIVVSPEASN